MTLQEDKVINPSAIIRGEDGKLFRCKCGCNVFSKLENGYYRCNACRIEYEAY